MTRQLRFANAQIKFLKLWQHASNRWLRARIVNISGAWAWSAQHCRQTVWGPKTIDLTNVGERFFEQGLKESERYRLVLLAGPRPMSRGHAVEQNASLNQPQRVCCKIAADVGLHFLERGRIEKIIKPTVHLVVSQFECGTESIAPRF
jgi:hypothetical protein